MGKITPQSLLRVRSVSISGLEGRSAAALSSAWLEHAPGPPAPGQLGAKVSQVPSLGGRRPLATPRRAPSELSLPQPSGLVHGVLRPSPHPAPSPVGSLVPEGLRRQRPGSWPLQGVPASWAAPLPHGGAWAARAAVPQEASRSRCAANRPEPGPGPGSSSKQSAHRRAGASGSWRRAGGPGPRPGSEHRLGPCNLRLQTTLPCALALGPGPCAIDPEGQTRVGPNPASATSQRFGPWGKSSGPLCAGVSVGEMGSVGVLPLAALVTTAWDGGRGAVRGHREAGVPAPVTGTGHRRCTCSPHQGNEASRGWAPVGPRGRGTARDNEPPGGCWGQGRTGRRILRPQAAGAGREGPAAHPSGPRPPTSEISRQACVGGSALGSQLSPPAEKPPAPSNQLGSLDAALLRLGVLAN